ncbi:hypothetical protein RRG08_001482 [Elysia crispata]|uniref:Uncharacterized protein n=1 Tax=Elysia crispata TaxID=231223 RepID=A0AAE0YNJ0_9GAST|nr:hypothetical protein RRG08_001482 [Elysia crispata]
MRKTKMTKTKRDMGYKDEEDREPGRRRGTWATRMRKTKMMKTKRDMGYKDEEDQDDEDEEGHGLQG